MLKHSAGTFPLQPTSQAEFFFFVLSAPSSRLFCLNLRNPFYELHINDHRWYYPKMANLAPCLLCGREIILDLCPFLWHHNGLTSTAACFSAHSFKHGANKSLFSFGKHCQNYLSIFKCSLTKPFYFILLKSSKVLTWYNRFKLNGDACECNAWGQTRVHAACKSVCQCPSYFITFVLQRAQRTLPDVLSRYRCQRAEFAVNCSKGLRARLNSCVAPAFSGQS